MGGAPYRENGRRVDLSSMIRTLDARLFLLARQCLLFFNAVDCACFSLLLSPAWDFSVYRPPWPTDQRTRARARVCEFEKIRTISTNRWKYCASEIPPHSPHLCPGEQTTFMSEGGRFTEPRSQKKHNLLHASCDTWVSVGASFSLSSKRLLVCLLHTTQRLLGACVGERFDGY